MESEAGKGNGGWRPPRRRPRRWRQVSRGHGSRASRDAATRPGRGRRPRTRLRSWPTASIPVSTGASRRSQLNTYVGPYRDALGLCPEDVYGVFPRETRRSSSSEDKLPGVGRLLDRLSRSPRVRAGSRGVGRRRCTPRDAKPLGGHAGKQAHRASSPARSATGRRRSSSRAWAGPGAARCERRARRGAEGPLAAREGGSCASRGPELGDALRAKIGDWGLRRPRTPSASARTTATAAIYFAWLQR